MNILRNEQGRVRAPWFAGATLGLAALTGCHAGDTIVSEPIATNITSSEASPITIPTMPSVARATTPIELPTTQHPSSPNIWPGTDPSTVSFPGSVVLDPTTCGSRSAGNREPLIRQGKIVLGVIDARGVYSSDCNQTTDSGAGTYSVPAYDPNNKVAYNGDTHTKDGTAVQIDAFTNFGQPSCDSTNEETQVWIKYQVEPGTNAQEFWTSAVNMGDVNSGDLQAAGINAVDTTGFNFPEVPSNSSQCNLYAYLPNEYPL